MRICSSRAVRTGGSPTLAPTTSTTRVDHRADRRTSAMLTHDQSGSPPWSEPRGPDRQCVRAGSGGLLDGVRRRRPRRGAVHPQELAEVVGRVPVRPSAPGGRGAAVGHTRWPGGAPGPGHPRVVRRAGAAARDRDPGGARGRRRVRPRPARPDVASQDPLGGAARAQGPPDRRGLRAARAGRGRQPRGAEPRRPVVPRADPPQRRPDGPRRLAHRRRPRGAAAAARGGAARRRVRDAALLPHPRRRATRTATPATSRAARWSPSWRGTACATCSTPRPRPSRPTGCGTSSGWSGSGTRGCGCGRPRRLRRRRAPSRRPAPAGTSGCRAPRRRARRRSRG